MNHLDRQNKNSIFRYVFYEISKRNTQIHFT